MIYPKTKTTVSGEDKIKKIQEEIRKMENSYVTIGVHEDAGRYDGADAPSVVEVALWNEFGTKSSPERSFFRSAIDDNSAQLNEWREEMINKIIDGLLTCEQSLHIIGQRIVILIQNKIKSNVPPELADSTAKRKEAEGLAPVTLMHTTLMLRSVTYKVFIV